MLPKVIMFDQWRQMIDPLVEAKVCTQKEMNETWDSLQSADDNEIHDYMTGSDSRWKMEGPPIDDRQEADVGRSNARYAKQVQIEADERNKVKRNGDGTATRYHGKEAFEFLDRQRAEQ